jgi:hypothetical protein
MNMGSMAKYVKFTLVPSSQWPDLTIMQILSLTANNASNNNTLVDDLSDLLNGFQGSETRIRCFAHILNLVVKVRRMCFCATTAIYQNIGHPIAIQSDQKGL